MLSRLLIMSYVIFTIVTRLYVFFQNYRSHVISQHPMKTSKTKQVNTIFLEKIVVLYRAGYNIMSEETANQPYLSTKIIFV